MSACAQGVFGESTSVSCVFCVHTTPHLRFPTWVEGTQPVQCFVFMPTGETKADDSSNRETTEEKQEEDNDYHRSDEQVGGTGLCIHSSLRAWVCFVLCIS